MVEIIKAGALPPSHMDGDYGEYTNGRFTIMMPMKNKKWD